MKLWLVLVSVALSGCSCEEQRQLGRRMDLREAGYSDPVELTGNQQLCGVNDDIAPVRFSVACNGAQQTLLLCCDTTGVRGRCRGLWNRSSELFQELPKCAETEEPKVGKTTGTVQRLDDPTNPPIYPCSEAQPDDCWVLPGGVKSVLRYSVPACQGDPLWYSDCWKGPAR